MLKWFHAFIAVSCSFAGATASEEHWPRFVLCPQATNTSNVGGISVFAASVVSEQPQLGRLHRPLSLRVALLCHDGLWDLSLAELPHGAKHFGHARHVSYAKCFGAGLPVGTKVFCGVGKVDGTRTSRNASWTQGRLARFDTGEVRQSFATCAIDQLRLIKRWRNRPFSWPARLRMRLWLHLPGRNQRLLFHLELCRVQQPVLPISFCSQPLYSFNSMSEEWPYLMEDWLAYHLDYLGFSHGDIYDVDGSFAPAMEPWTQSNSWRKNTVSYFREWPKQLSVQLENISKAHPYCTEMLAYAHCLTSHAARSRWVALLHAPDEYLIARKTPYVGALPDVMRFLSDDLPKELPFAFFQVNAVSFASERKDSKEEMYRQGGGKPGKRGGVLATSRQRMPMGYHHMPVVDPLNCWAAGAHMCYGEAGRFVESS